VSHRLLWFAVVSTVAVRFVGVAGQGHEFAFSTIDFPGATLTNVQGINAGGDIVGFYTDTNGKTHGFVSSGGDFRSVDYKDSKSTQLRGIGPAGDIVGTYQRQNESGAVPIHGFLFTRQGEFAPIDHPEHQNTITQRILANGTILGCYHDSDTMGTMHGLSLSRRGFDALAEATTMHNGATPDGRLIVGLFTDMMDNRGKGYFFDGARFTPFEVPGATSTAAWDVNPAGVAVGVFRDGGGQFHGFTYDGVSFGQVDVPDATATRVFGINAGGDLVGAYVDKAGRTHGFLAQRPK
jgi:probable HAF family extracellular repeat protein